MFHPVIHTTPLCREIQVKNTNLHRAYERFGLPLIVAALFFTLLLTPMAQAQTMHVQHGERSLAAPETVSSAVAARH